MLTAFQNVADTLTALEQDAEALKAAADAADAAKVTLDLSQRQWQDGYASYLALLSAEQAYQQARINLVQAQANRYADTAALFQALGGGWWHRAELAEDNMKNDLIALAALRARRRHVAAMLVGSPAVRLKPDAEHQPTVTASNVTLTAAQRQHIHLYTVAAVQLPQDHGSHRRGRFRQRSGHQRAGAVLRPGVAAAGFPRRSGQARRSRWRTWIHPILPPPSAPIARRSPPPQTARRLADLDKDLLQHNGVAQREAEQAETDAANAEADRDAALQALVSLNVDPQAIKDIQEGRPVARVEGVIRAPIAGTVVEKLITPGQLLQAGTTPCFHRGRSFARLGHGAGFRLRPRFGAASATRRQVVTGIGAATSPGTVDNISALVDPDTRSVMVRVVVDNPGELAEEADVCPRADPGAPGKHRPAGPGFGHSARR